jgi:chromosome segregation ATPase
MAVACRVEMPQADDPPGNDRGIAQGWRGSNARSKVPNAGTRPGRSVFFACAAALKARGWHCGGRLRLLMIPSIFLAGVAFTPVACVLIIDVQRREFFTMLVFVAWLVLLAATAVLAALAFQLDLAHIVAGFLALAPAQQAAIGLVVVMAAALTAFTLWQSWRLAHQSASWCGGRGGLQRSIVVAGATQKDFDAAVQHLLSSDPEEAISALDSQVTEAEARSATQRGRNQAVDMQERLEQIRRRQQALREQIGEVAEARRAMEPVFEELKNRQRQLERSLDKVETDDNNNNLGERLEEFDHKMARTSARHKALQDSFATLDRSRDELAKSIAELAAVQAPETGIKALLADLSVKSSLLLKEIEQLETSDGERITSRVEALDNGKKDAEQRIIRLEGSYTMLDTIRRDFVELGKRQDELRLAFAEIETDGSGRGLAGRLAELEEFSAQTRLRLRTLQEALTTLNRFRRDLVNSQSQLTPLHAPGEGINAAMVELDSRAAQIAATLNELEVSGGEKLGSRIEALAENKRLAEQRIVQVFEQFERLESIRNEIAKTFANLNSALNKLC